jgi:hypothetical protein
MTAATWRVRDLVGAQQIDVTDTVQNHKLGTIIRAHSDTYGEGEFIYLLGVASTVVGSIVKYNATSYLTVLLVNTAGQAVPLAVAMSANVASQYGWYQISGLAVIKKTSVAVTPQVKLYISATAGRVKVIASAGLEILNCRTANLTTIVTTTSTVTALINRPFAQGQIT